MSALYNVRFFGRFHYMFMLFIPVVEIEVKKNSFRVYRQMQKTTQKNYVNLRFKTIHATGLIMLVRGANKKDYLSIELYRGKIRFVFKTTRLLFLVCPTNEKTKIIANLFLEFINPPKNVKCKYYLKKVLTEC